MEEINTYEDILLESLTPKHLEVMHELTLPIEDIKVSEKLEIDHRELRKILNQLLDARLVSYKKHKDKETANRKTIWSLRTDKIKDYSKKYLQEKINYLNEEITHSTSQMYYACECRKVHYSKAIDDGFTCSKCGEPYLHYKDHNVETKVNEVTRLNSLLHQLT